MSQRLGAAIVLAACIVTAACGANENTAQDQLSSASDPAPSTTEMSSATTQASSPDTLAEPTLPTDGAMVAQSDTWRQEGQRLRDAKANQKPPDGMTVANYGDWAYQTNPVDITGPGDFTLTTGPVPSWFDPPRNPAAVSIDTPYDAGFDTAITDMHAVDGADGRYLQISLHVDAPVGGKAFEPYPGYSLWIY